MPSDNFEKSLRQRFQGVEIPPRPEVWEGIQLNMASPKGNQRKWWLSLVALGFLLLSFSTYWLFTNSPKQELDPLIQSDSKNRLPSENIENEKLTDEGHTPPTDEKYAIKEPKSEWAEPQLVKPLQNKGEKPFEKVEFSIEASTQKIHSSLEDSVNIPAQAHSFESIGNTLPYNEEAYISSSFLPIPLMKPVEMEGFSHEMVLAGTPPTIGMDQLAGSPLPGPSKWAISFYVRPELPWYTSTSISIEQDPPRTAEVDFPPDVAVSEPEFGELVAGQDRPSLVFYEINYARSGLSAGLTVGYYMNPQLSIHTGLGIFASGKHRLSPVSGVRPDSSNFSTNNSPTSDFSMQNFQLEVPILAQYTFASDRSSWLIQGGVSLNTSLNKLEFDFDNNESAFRSLGSPQTPLIQKSSHLHAELGIMYRFHLNSKLNLYLGPSQTYGLSPVYQTLQGKNIYLNRLSLRMGIEFR